MKHTMRRVVIALALTMGLLAGSTSGASAWWYEPEWPLDGGGTYSYLTELQGWTDAEAGAFTRGTNRDGSPRITYPHGVLDNPLKGMWHPDPGDDPNSPPQGVGSRDGDHYVWWDMTCEGKFDLDWEGKPSIASFQPMGAGEEGTGYISASSSSGLAFRKFGPNGSIIVDVDDFPMDPDAEWQYALQLGLKMSLKQYKDMKWCHFRWGWRARQADGWNVGFMSESSRLPINGSGNVYVSDPNGIPIGYTWMRDGYNADKYRKVGNPQQGKCYDPRIFGVPGQPDPAYGDPVKEIACPATVEIRDRCYAPNAELAEAIKLLDEPMLSYSDWMDRAINPFLEFYGGTPTKWRGVGLEYYANDGFRLIYGWTPEQARSFFPGAFLPAAPGCSENSVAPPAGGGSSAKPIPGSGSTNESPQTRAPSSKWFRGNFRHAKVWVHLTQTDGAWSTADLAQAKRQARHWAKKIKRSGLVAGVRVFKVRTAGRVVRLTMVEADREWSSRDVKAARKQARRVAARVGGRTSWKVVESRSAESQPTPTKALGV